MPSEKVPLAFEIRLRPTGEDKCPGIINTGDSFDFNLTISVNNSGHFAHRGVDCEFSSEFCPKQQKAAKLNQGANADRRSLKKL
jgi:hypothetical protein